MEITDDLGVYMEEDNNMDIEGGWHSESLRPSDMGSVQNLIGMPSNGYVPKVAV